MLVTEIKNDGHLNSKFSNGNNKVTKRSVLCSNSSYPVMNKINFLVVYFLSPVRYVPRVSDSGSTQ